MAKKSTPPRIAPLRRVIAEVADLSELLPAHPRTRGSARARKTVARKDDRAADQLLALWRQLPSDEQSTLLARLAAQLPPQTHLNILVQVAAALPPEVVHQLQTDLQKRFPGQSERLLGARE